MDRAELSDRLGAAYQTTTTELRRLDAAGLVTTETVGRTRRVVSNGASPYNAPLTELIAMSFGPPFVIGDELAVVDQIDDVFIYGSWASRALGEVGPPPNDIDVLVFGTPDRDLLYDAAIAC